MKLFSRVHPSLFLLLSTACGGGTPPATAPEPVGAPPVGASSAAPETSSVPTAPADAAAAPHADEARPRLEPLSVTPAAQKVVDAPDRDAADKALDPGRHPGELLTFLALSPGMHVAEIGAGRGYTTELLARAVGPTGKVWAENPPAILKFIGPAFKERLAKPVMKNVVPLELDPSSALPSDVKNLDAVVSMLIYHDTVWLGVDRDKMNKVIFDALKKGGEYVIVDHSAAPGHGINDVKTLHRIEESTVVADALRAGFQQAASSNFLRNPDDDRDWNDSPNAAGDKRGKSDRFALKFVRP